MRTRCIVVPIHLSLAASLLVAQEPSIRAADRPTAIVDSSSDTLASKTFFTRRDLAYTGAAMVGTAGISHFDARIAHWTQQPSEQAGSFRRIVRPFNNVSETTVVWAAIVGYGAGRIARSSMIADVSAHVGEALALSTVIGQTVRGVLGRDRPSSSPDDQYSFHAGRGFTHFENRAFPSLHSAAAFVLASALTEEIHERQPGAVWYVAPVLYTAAAAPGIARMYLGQHWASDVAAGAFMGTLLGSRVVSYAHSHRRSRLDRFLLGASAMPDGRGAIRLTFSVVR